MLTAEYVVQAFASTINCHLICARESLQSGELLDEWNAPELANDAHRWIDNATFSKSHEASA